MPYDVTFTTSAGREVAKLECTLQRRIIRKIEALADNPRPAGCCKLAGSDDTYRIRIGDYRVVYEIHDGELLVLIVRVRHRREVYR